MIPIDDPTLDLSIFILTNVANMAVFTMFMLRVFTERGGRYAGMFFISLAVPTGIIAGINLMNGREWWLWVFPTLFIIFCIYTFLLDFVLKIEFRKPRRNDILVPYLLLFYISIILMWGISWSIGLFYGAVTGVTYFLQLGGAAYAGKKGVG